MVLMIVGGVCAVVVLWFIAAYNNLIRQKNMLAESLSGIAVQQKRRYDLIPNLVATVSGYSVHEKELLESIVSLRGQALSAGGPAQAAAADNNLTGALKSLFALSENYPDLKANQNFLSLQADLGALESELQLARRYYNGVARNYNTAIHTFPSVIVASMFGYSAVEYFVLESEVEAQAPRVKF